jgi:hypothetical protein
VWHDTALAKKALTLAAELRAGVEKWGIMEHSTFGTVYCYEVDGLGGCNVMDDANVPSLLSLPHLDPTATTFDRRIYDNTRRLILSPKNPFFFEGSFAKGIGSPHMLSGKKIWPMALIMQALTTEDNQEKIALVKTLAATTGGTSFMHESFDVNDPKNFTRPWFAWANALFAELMYHVTGEWCVRRPPGSDSTNRGAFKAKWGSGTVV